MNAVTDRLGHCHMILLLTAMRLYLQSHTQTTVAVLFRCDRAAKESKMKYCELLNQKKINETTAIHTQCTWNEELVFCLRIYILVRGNVF